MQKNKINILIILLFCFAIYGKAQKPEPPLNRILFVFDASQSMYGTWESDKKINIARKYLIQIIDSLEKIENIQLALRIYGHQSPVPPQDCSDTKLEVPFKIGNAPEIRQKLRYLVPKGTTPIARSIELAANDFPTCTNCRNIIILITDGIEACDGDPCQASLNLQKKGIVLKPFVIGIGSDPNFEKTFECVGHYYESPKEEKFSEVLSIVISRALNTTTAQVNLLDIHGNPTETDVNITFFDDLSGKVRYNFIHTLNHKGNPDTLIIDPLAIYNLVVNTIPSIKKQNVKLTEGKHNIIGIDAPQGYLTINSTGTNLYEDLKILVKESGKSETINVQNNEQTEKYLIGEYDIEVLTIPRLSLKKVKIEQSSTTKLEIPKPGIANFSFPSSGFASLYQETADSLIWVYNFNEKTIRQTLVLQPGNYRVIYKPKNIKESIYTVNKSFLIKSGLSNTIILL